MGGGGGYGAGGGYGGGYGGAYAGGYGQPAPYAQVIQRTLYALLILLSARFAILCCSHVQKKIIRARICAVSMPSPEVVSVERSCVAGSLSASIEGRLLCTETGTIGIVSCHVVHLDQVDVTSLFRRHKLALTAAMFDSTRLRCSQPYGAPYGAPAYGGGYGAPAPYGGGYGGFPGGTDPYAAQVRALFLALLSLAEL